MAADVLTKGVERGNIKGMIWVMTVSVMTLKPSDEMLEVRARHREDLAERKKNWKPSRRNSRTSSWIFKTRRKSITRFSFLQ